MGIEQNLERVEVLGVDHRVVRPVAAALNLAGGHQPRVDRIAERGDHDQVVDGPARGLALSLRGLVPDQVGHAGLVGPANPDDPPQPAVDAARLLVTLRQEPDLVAPTHWPVRQLYRLGDVTLEVEPERAPPGQRLHFPLQVGGKLRVLRLYLLKQVTQPRHEPLLLT